MLIQKTFHIHQSVTETRRSLANVSAYQRHLAGVKEARMTADGKGHIEVTPGFGQTISADFAEVPCEKSDGCVTFRSRGGNIQFAGICEFFQVKENLTEVVVTIDYRLVSPLHRAVDWATSAMEHFINRQLEQIQIYFDGMHAASHRAVSRELPAGMRLGPTPKFA